MGGGPLFIHQYSQAWIDLRDRVEQSAVRWTPIVLTSRRLFRQFGGRHSRAARIFHQISRRNSKGIPPTLGHYGLRQHQGLYRLGRASEDPRIDGTVVPSAAAGSLMFTPDICIPAMRTMLLNYGKTIYGRYGFADAFNP